MWAYKLLIVLKAAIGNAEISSSSDLNCDFSSSCRWRNATNLEDNGDWIINNQYAADGTTFIIPREASDGYFAYTSSLIARSVALLISDVVNCQLGGANIKYWYFKTGSESQLEVCTRQPPGSKEFNSFKCYTGSTTNFAQQWIFRVIELPPLSQPFELVFRSTFYPPMDIVALSDIVYTSTLCEISNKGAQQGAGGSFQTEDSTAKLLKFNEGKAGSFVYAGGKAVSRHDKFILSNKIPIEISEPARLDFFVYQAGVKGRLQVCINNIKDCVLDIRGDTINIKARRWRNFHVPLATNTHAIHFVADGLQDNYAIGLDHIQLLNKHGMAAQQCR
ncbi:MAM domain protein [Dictyocaulus viviparus]|uniref:MAM domain protein n=1 Tax=Dictyocaulus viviparus TaxID=29172 RepID=A0A0D8Y1I8_DICVI|nr:MAM domain protein [Dictyocaulus viviparus]